MFGKKYPKGTFCPFVRGECVQHECALYTRVLGKRPQSEAVTEEFGCALAFLPTLIIENAQMQRQTCATVDKVAKEVQMHRAAFISVLSEEVQDRAIEAQKNAVEKISAPQEPNGTSPIH